MSPEQKGVPSQPRASKTQLATSSQPGSGDAGRRNVLLDSQRGLEDALEGELTGAVGDDDSGP
jgi:hypothetical protein